jgi:hypothetical protein
MITKLAIEDRVYAIVESMQSEIAREIRVLLGEEQYDPRIFSEADKARRIEALKKCAREQTSDAERHESWMRMHFEQGWKYGPELKPAEKEHPNLLPWDQLPPSTRSKARVFDICAKYAAALTGLACGLALPPATQRELDS